MTSPITLLHAWGIRPKKRAGQNFLTDPSTADMIVARSKLSGKDVVLEIGAGLGALTIPLAKIAKKVYAVEKDPQIVTLLKTELAVNHLANVEIMETNILNLDIKNLAKSLNQKMIVMGNLPYNISSQILVQLVHSRSAVSRAVLMLQKELVGRIASPPGRKDYGRLSVMFQYCADIKPITHVMAHLFFPKPKVDSTVLEIKFKNQAEYVPKDEAFFFSVIKAAFGQRRKTLKNAISGSDLKIDAAKVSAACSRCCIDPSRRAETLSVDEFVRLSNSLQTTKED